MRSPLFDQIQVQPDGTVTYKAPKGFKLDEASLTRTAAMFRNHCPPDMAIKHAVHQQIVAYRGLQELLIKKV